MRSLFTLLFGLLLATVASAQQSSHVFILMLENRSDDQAMRYMPYLAGLTDQYGRGLQAYSPSHGSFNAYLEVVAGSHPVNGESDNGNCNGDNCQHPYTQDNMVRELNASHMTWRGYFQSMPLQGFMGYTYGDYVKRHNPYAYLSDVVNDHDQQGNMYPWDDNFAADLASGNVANYTWLVPDLTHDGHNPGDDDETALHNADGYLSEQLPALLRSRYFQPGGDGVLLVSFDESELQGDNSCSQNQPQGCGGHILFAVIGPLAKSTYQTSTHIMQNDMLRGTCELLGVSSCPGDGAQAAGIAELFQAQHLVVTITAPYNYYPDAGPATYLNANAHSEYGPITQWAVYVDGNLYAHANGSPTLQMWVSTSMGQHVIEMKAWDGTGAMGSSEVHITRTH
jgi:phosphatidylinositol-3-phosphatase